MRRSTSAIGGMTAGAALTALLAGCADRPKLPVMPAAAMVKSNAAATCTTQRFPIYFEPTSAMLSREQVDVINAAAQRVKGCEVSKLDVVGLAGLEAPPERAEEISRQRSVVVADALKAAGLPAPRFDLSSIGSEGAKGKNGKRPPLRRRAEVIIYAGVQTTATAK